MPCLTLHGLSCSRIVTYGTTIEAWYSFHGWLWVSRPQPSQRPGCVAFVAASVRVVHTICCSYCRDVELHIIRYLPAFVLFIYLN